MRAWASILGGLVIWAAHFFVIYTAAIIFVSSVTAHWIGGAMTLICVVAEIWLFVKLRRSRDLDGWLQALGLASCAFSLVAITWQSFPIFA